EFVQIQRVDGLAAHLDDAAAAVDGPAHHLEDVLRVTGTRHEVAAQVKGGSHCSPIRDRRGSRACGTPLTWYASPRPPPAHRPAGCPASRRRCRGCPG